MERLDKVIASSTTFSRSDVRSLIRDGRITVDGTVAVRCDMKVGEDAIVAVDGEPVLRKRRFVGILHKTSGYVTSISDPLSPTVMDLVPPWWRDMEIYPAGRLDKDTEGLLVFTNDGDLAHRLISPKHRVEKEYYAEHIGNASSSDVEAFRNGIVLEDGTRCLPAILVPLGEGRSLITLTEGKYHQVRRMMASRGLGVTYLRRIREGGLLLGDMEKGCSRELTAEEERLLFE